MKTVHQNSFVSGLVRHLGKGAFVAGFACAGLAFAQSVDSGKPLADKGAGDYSRNIFVQAADPTSAQRLAEYKIGVVVDACVVANGTPSQTPLETRSLLESRGRSGNVTVYRAEAKAGCSNYDADLLGAALRNEAPSRPYTGHHGGRQ